MMPSLYPEHERQFSNLGFGGLGAATSMEVLTQLNGAQELTMLYPGNGPRTEEISARRIIYSTTDQSGNPQPFRIYRIERQLQGNLAVYARHVAYDLMGHTMAPFAASGLAQAMGNMQSIAVVQPHDFTFAADFESAAACKSLTPRSVWSMMGGQRGSLLDVYGGEWEFDGWKLTLHRAVGADRGLLIRYGKNLRTLEQDENLANTWTGVHPFWLAPDESACVTLPEHTVSAGEFDYVRIMPLDLSAEFQEPPTAEQLRSTAKRYISANGIGIPAVGLDVDFVLLDQTEEFKRRAFLTSVAMGDTVAVEFPTSYDRETGAPKAFARASSRVVETVWLPMENRFKRVRLGRKRANFATAVVNLQKDTAWLMSKTR